MKGKIFGKGTITQ